MELLDAVGLALRLPGCQIFDVRTPVEKYCDPRVLVLRFRRNAGKVPRLCERLHIAFPQGFEGGGGGGHRLAIIRLSPHPFQRVPELSIPTFHKILRYIAP